MKMISEANYSPAKASYRSKVVYAGGHDGRSQSLVGNLFAGGRTSQTLLSCLLGATLFTSVLNTLLLSFVVKSIQLNDLGLINGQIHWDESSASSIINAPTRLPAKSIRADLIESERDKQLKFGISSEGVHLSAANANTNPNLSLPKSALFLSTAATTATPSLSTNAKSNYLAIHANNEISKSKRKLEIGAKAVELNLVDKSASNPDKLFEFDDKQQLITLALERKLNLSPPTSGSLLIKNQLTSSEITGTFENNLDVQTRGGDLNCYSANALRLVSKSAGIGLTSSEELTVKSSSSVVLNSDGLFIPSGIKYFDVEPFGWQPVDSNIRAYNLLSVNGFLMAA